MLLITCIKMVIKELFTMSSQQLCCDKDVINRLRKSFKTIKSNYEPLLNFKYFNFALKLLLITTI